MKARNRQTGRARWVALVAVLVLVLGIGRALRQWGVLHRPARGDHSRLGVAPKAPGTEPPPQMVDQALQQISPATRAEALLDSAAIKHRWLDEVRGIDVSALDPKRLDLFIRFANARACTCGCGYTLAGCRASDMTCEVSGSALEALRDSIRMGRITSARGIRARPRSGG